MLADIQAYLRPSETLVVVPITDSDAWTFLTFPLPGHDDALTCQITSAMVAAELRRFPRAHQIFVATFTNRQPRRPMENLQWAVIARAHEGGVHLLGSYYVSDAGWGSYLCDHPDCTGPRPLHELVEGAERLASLGD